MLLIFILAPTLELTLPMIKFCDCSFAIPLNFLDNFKYVKFSSNRDKF